MSRDGDRSYLSFSADLGDPAMVSAYDELPLWSAMSGLVLLKHVPLRRDAVILDLGCGTGFPLLEIAQRCGPASRACGIDMWTAALARAEQKRRLLRVSDVALTRGDAAALPFRDGAFDLAVSNLGINNFADPEAAFAECRRVLKPGGTIALTTNLQGHMAEFYAVFEVTLSDLGDGAAIGALRTHVDHRATVARVAGAFERTGLAVRRVHEESATMRFADGTALLHDHFIKLGFLGAWKDVVAPDRRDETFARLEAALNDEATQRGVLELTIPIAYIEGTRG